MTPAPRITRWTGALQVDRPLDARTLLITLLVASLLLRALIAVVLVPRSGFQIDVNDFASWAQTLAADGPRGFYRPGYFADYPPAYLYVLWALGGIGGLVGGLVGDPNFVTGLVKIPGVLADIGVGALLFVIGCRFFDERVGLVAAAVYLLNPGVIFDSAVWGQVDSVGTLVLLAGLYLLSRGWTEAAAAVAVLAMLVKFQYAFLIPIVLVVGLKRHLGGRSADPWLDARPDFPRVLTSLAAGLFTLIVLLWPFGMALYAPHDEYHSLWHLFTRAADTYPHLSINAFNLWMNPISDIAASPGSWGSRDDDPALAILTIGTFAVTPQLVGSLLFLAVAAVALRFVWRRDDGPALLFAALILAVAFFALPTRVHERYLFPALALAAPFVALAWRWRVLYGVLSASFFFNVYWAYTLDWSFVGYVLTPGVGGEPMQRDPLLAATILSSPGVYLLSFAIVALLVWLVALALRPAALTWGPWAAAAGAQAADASPSGAAAVAGGAAHRSPQPAEAREPAVGESFFARARRWLTPDAGAALRPDSVPRLEKRHALLFGAVLVIALVFRVWRLGSPVPMHFDEVYHARSAAEWLANWQYGAGRDVYEWTHPMLAKYLIAAGIVVADPNRVVAGQEVEQAPELLAVAVGRASVGRDRSMLFSVDGGAEVVVRDAETYREVGGWSLPEPAGALAFDDAAEQLLVGSQVGGAVVRYDVSALLRGSVAPRAPPPEADRVETGLRGIEQIVVTPGQPLAVRAADGIALVDAATGQVTASSALQAGGLAHVPASSSEESPQIAATDRQGRSARFLDAGTLEELASVAVNGIPVGPLVVQGEGGEQQVFVPVESADGSSAGAVAVIRASTRAAQGSVPLPDVPRDLLWHRVANLLYISGPQQVWTLEPHGDNRTPSCHLREEAPPKCLAGFAVFDTTELAGTPVAMALDASSYSPSDDNERLIVATRADDGRGGLMSVDAGSNAFAWRLAGAAFGALLAALTFLLAATIFRRLSVALLAGAFVAFDAMSFAQSRIAMNDVFVAVFILAAYLLFWQVWSGRWSRSAWWALPAVGVLIGLAAATKWVGFYALAGLLILVLARSDLGRLTLLAGFSFLFIVAGLGAPWPFGVALLLSVMLLALLAWARPIRIAREDLLALPASGVVIGAIGFAFALSAGSLDRDDAVGLVAQLLARGAEAIWPAALMITITVALLVARAVRSLRDRESDARWYLPSEMGGFSWPWIGACLLVVPLVVYTLTFVPYLQLGHTFARPDAGPGYGWSLEELHVQMFSYHFGLLAGHPASSPWWSWPLTLRPVWFYQSPGWDGGSLAVIYNGGNPILFWAGVPAIAFCAIQAWRRQSLGLVLLTVAFAMQWLPWTRIERATFLYHYFTALPFFMVAVAWVTDEALRRRTTAALARGFLAAAAIAAVLLYPIAGAVPLPEWYVHFFQALPPWNFHAQFPSPPQNERELISAGGGGRLLFALLAAALAAGFALFGRTLLRGGTGPPSDPRRPVPESG